MTSFSPKGQVGVSTAADEKAAAKALIIPKAYEWGERDTARWQDAKRRDFSVNGWVDEWVGGWVGLGSGGEQI